MTSHDAAIEGRSAEDALIRAYLLTPAREWAEYEGTYGWVRDRRVGDRNGPSDPGTNDNPDGRGDGVETDTRPGTSPS